MGDPKLPFGTNRCKCGGCGEYFGGVRAFEIHRQGTPDDRRCLSQSGMENLGLRLDSLGYWGRDYARAE